MSDEDWKRQALCLHADVDLWFSPNPWHQAIAVATCNGCPVRETCLDHAMTNDERYGIWGGLTEEQRDTLAGRKRRRRGAEPEREAS